jgi:hypothetical protein
MCSRANVGPERNSQLVETVQRSYGQHGWTLYHGLMIISMSELKGNPLKRFNNEAPQQGSARPTSNKDYLTTE